MKNIFRNFDVLVTQAATLIYFLICLCLNVFNIFALGVTCGIDSWLGIIFFTAVFLTTTCTSFFFLSYFCKEAFKAGSINYLKAVYLFIVIVSTAITLIYDLPQSKILWRTLYY